MLWVGVPLVQKSSLVGRLRVAARRGVEKGEIQGSLHYGYGSKSSVSGRDDVS